MDPGIKKDRAGFRPALTEKIPAASFGGLGISLPVIRMRRSGEDISANFKH
jgi:hypothetical protein